MAAPTSGGSRGFEPGAAPYGNFPNYSRFHPPEGRLCLLPRGLLRSLFPAATRPLLGLDVGCNSGELSVALYQHLLGLQDGEGSAEGAGKELRLLCCDIDPELVRRAQQSSPFPGCISFAALDIMDGAAREALLGPFLRRFGRSRFDLAFCMSVTMWVHLRHGDGGLRALLALLASLSRVLLLEPQPWRCYRAAARRLRRLGRRDFQHFRSLGIRGDMAQSVTRILTQHCAMELLCCFGTTAWDRSLLLFGSTAAPPEGRCGPGAALGERHGPGGEEQHSPGGEDEEQHSPAGEDEECHSPGGEEQHSPGAAPERCHSPGAGNEEQHSPGDEKCHSPGAGNEEQHSPGDEGEEQHSPGAGDERCHSPGAAPEQCHSPGTPPGEYHNPGAAPEGCHSPGAGGEEGELGIPESLLESGLNLLGESEARNGCD